MLALDALHVGSLLVTGESPIGVRAHKRGELERGQGGHPDRSPGRVLSAAQEVHIRWSVSFLPGLPAADPTAEVGFVHDGGRGNPVPHADVSGGSTSSPLSHLTRLSGGPSTSARPKARSADLRCIGRSSLQGAWGARRRRAPGMRRSRHRPSPARRCSGPLGSRCSAGGCTSAPACPRRRCDDLLGVVGARVSHHQELQVGVGLPKHRERIACRRTLLQLYVAITTGITGRPSTTGSA